MVGESMRLLTAGLWVQILPGEPKPRVRHVNGVLRAFFVRHISILESGYYRTQGKLAAVPAATRFVPVRIRSLGTVWQHFEEPSGNYVTESI